MRLPKSSHCNPLPSYSTRKKVWCAAILTNCMLACTMIPREIQGRKGGEGKERRRGKGEEIEEAAAAAEKSSMGAGLAVVAVDGGQQAVSCRWLEGSEHKVCQEHRVSLIKKKLNSVCAFAVSPVRCMYCLKFVVDVPVQAYNRSG